MNSIYFKCLTSDCKLNKYTVFYGEEIPDEPSCNECLKPYTRIVEKDDDILDNLKI